MDDYGFWQILFNAVRPEEHAVIRGETLCDFKHFFAKDLMRLKDILPEASGELLEKLEDYFSRALQCSEEGYFVAGVKFGVSLMHAAFIDD